MQKNPLLTDLLLGKYFPAKLTIRTPRAKYHYVYSLKKMSVFLGHRPRLSDLTDDNVAGTMVAMLNDGKSEVTANGVRFRLHALWSWLAKRGYLKEWPTTELVPEPERLPVAWRQEELAAIMASCHQAKGDIGGVPACLWWEAYHLVAWNTGERTGAMLQLEQRMLDLKNGILHVAAKIRKGGRKPVVYHLRPETVSVLEAIKSPRRKLIFFFPHHHATFYNRYRELLKRAGLPFDRYCMPQKMRVSHATWVQALGGDASASLRHESPRTTRKSYLDPTICDKDQSEVLFSIKK